MDDTIYAVLDNKAGENKKYDQNDETLLAVLAAWKVDLKKVKFVKLDIADMRCPASSIFSADQVR